MKNRLTKHLIYFAILLTVSQLAMAQKQNMFTLKQTVDYAIQNSFIVKNALLDIQVQQQSNKEITAGAYPRLTASGSIQDYLKIPTSLLPAEIFGGNAGEFIPIKFGTKYNASGGLDLSQLLFDGQVFVGLQARKSSIDFYTKQAEVTEESIKVNVIKLYYQLLVSKQQMTSIDANIDRFQKLLNDTREIYKQGFAEKLDVDKVTVQLNNLQTEKSKTQSLVDAGNATLKFLINMPQAEQLILADTITKDQITEGILQDSVKYSDRKEFQLASIGQKLNEYNIKRYKLSYLPTVELFANYSKNAQRNEFDFLKGGKNREWFSTSIIGLKISYNIFDGFAKRARLDKAKLQLAITNNNIEQLKSSIDRDVEQAKLSIATAISTLKNQKSNIDLAEKVYNTTKKKYEAGLGSNQEIYNAQTDLKVAQNNYYSAMYDAVIAKVDYLRAIGKLN